MLKTNETVKTTLRAEGFACPSCVSKIEKRVGKLPGVSHVLVRFASARIEVQHDPNVTSVEKLVAAVKKAGYAATPTAF